jgi:antitoxin HicB
MASYKTIEEYLNLPYTLEVTRDNDADDPGWVARIIELPGCITQGDTFEELGEMIEDAMRAWIEVSMEDGDPIPEPRPIEDFSGKFVTRVPRSLHRDLVQAAEKEGVSLNAIVNVALARAVGRPSPALIAADNPPQPLRRLDITLPSGAPRLARNRPGNKGRGN